jgi:hypothetical protein
VSRRRLAVLCLAAAAATLLVCCAQARKLPPIPPPVPLGHTSPEAYTGPGAYTEIACSKEVLAAARMYYSDEVMVYRTTKRPPTREDVLAVAKHLGAKPTPEVLAAMPETREGPTYPVTFSPWDIDVGDDGWLRITDRRVESMSDQRGRRISDARARGAADRFLERTGLLPGNCRFTDVRIRQTHSGTLPNGQGYEVIDLVGVRYTRYLGKLPDGDLMVEVTADGKVYGVVGRLPEVTPAGRYPIITPEEALASFRAGEVQMMGPGGRVPERWSGVRYRAEVESLYLAYTGVAPYTDTVSYLHPVYLIQAKVYDGERLLPDRLTGWVPAVKWEYLDESLLDARYR